MRRFVSCIFFKAVCIFQYWFNDNDSESDINNEHDFHDQNSKNDFSDDETVSPPCGRKSPFIVSDRDHLYVGRYYNFLLFLSSCKRLLGIVW